MLTFNPRRTLLLAHFQPKTNPALGSSSTQDEPCSWLTFNPRRTLLFAHLQPKTNCAPTHCLRLTTWPYDSMRLHTEAYLFHSSTHYDSIRRLKGDRRPVGRRRVSGSNCRGLLPFRSSSTKSAARILCPTVRSSPRPRKKWATYCGLPAGALRTPSLGPVLLHRHGT